MKVRHFFLMLNILTKISQIVSFFKKYWKVQEEPLGKKGINMNFIPDRNEITSTTNNDFQDNFETKMTMNESAAIQVIY